MEKERKSTNKLLNKFYDIKGCNYQKREEGSFHIINTMYMKLRNLYKRQK